MSLQRHTFKFSLKRTTTNDLPTVVVLLNSDLLREEEKIVAASLSSTQIGLFFHNLKLKEKERAFRVGIQTFFFFYNNGFTKPAFLDPLLGILSTQLMP